MHVGLIFDHLDPANGGAERSLVRMLRWLHGRGHELELWCRSSVEGPWRSRAWTGRRFGRGAQEQAFSDWACRAARRAACDVVWGVRHVVDVDLYQPHGGTWAATMAGRDLAREPGRFGRWWRECSGRQSYFRAVDRGVFSRCPGLLTVAVSEAVREDVLRRYGEYEPRVRVIWPAVEVPARDAQWVARRRRRRAQLRLADGAPLLLFAAHQFGPKGLAEAIDALARMERRDARLLVRGRGPAERFRRQAARAGVAGRVEFAGPASEPWDDHAAADVVVHPTFYDPCALVTLEALALGTPVVTSRHNGASYWVRPERGVVVGDPRDAVALSRALDHAVQVGPSPPDEFPLGWEDHARQFQAALEEAAR